MSEIYEGTAYILIFFYSSGKVSIVPVNRWIEPMIDSEEEETAAERARQMLVSSCGGEL